MSWRRHEDDDSKKRGQARTGRHRSNDRFRRGRPRYRGLGRGMVLIGAVALLALGFASAGALAHPSSILDTITSLTDTSASTDSSSTASTDTSAATGTTSTDTTASGTTSTDTATTGATSTGTTTTCLYPPCS